MMQCFGRCSRSWVGMFAIIVAAMIISGPTFAQVDPFPPEVWHNVYDYAGYNDAGNGVTIDGNSNVIVVGYRGTEAAGTPHGQGLNAYMRVYDHLGTFVCEREVMGPGTPPYPTQREVNDSFSGVAVDSQDNIIVAGTISGDYSIGGYYVAMYLNKYYQDCNPVWGGPVIYKHPGGDSAWQGAYSVTLDTNDNIYATGSVFADWATGIEHEWATWKYDANGALQNGFPILYNYSTTYQYVDYSYDVAVDSLGNIIVVGIRGQGVNNYDGHIRKYDPAGTLIWSDTYVGTASLADYAYRVAVDSQNHPIVVGYTNKGTDNGANANYDWLIIKYAVDGVGTAGQRIWTKTYESATGRSEAAQAVAIDGDNNIIVGGYVQDAVGNLSGRLALLDSTTGDTIGERMITDPAHVIPLRLAYRNGAIAIGGYVWDPAGTNHNMYAALLEPDITPNLFSFTDRTGVALNTLVESNVITVTGIEYPSPISITGGEYSISGDAYTSVAGYVNNLATVRVRQTSSSSYSTTTNATLTIGGVSDTFSVKTIAVIGPTSPADGETFTACSYYAPPLFQWTLNQAFQKLEIRIFTPSNPAKPVKVKVKDPTATQLQMTQSTLKKVLKLPGLSGGALNWKIVGTNKGLPIVESEVFAMTIAAPEPAGKPDISPVTQSGIPTLTWGNSCATKFKVYFSADSAFSKAKKLSFTDQDPTDNGGAFSATLTDKTWISIRKLIEDIALGPHIYWKVESWDIIKRYQTTDLMEFTLLP